MSIRQITGAVPATALLMLTPASVQPDPSHPYHHAEKVWLLENDHADTARRALSKVEAYLPEGKHALVIELGGKRRKWEVIGTEKDGG